MTPEQASAECKIYLNIRRPQIIRRNAYKKAKASKIV